MAKISTTERDQAFFYARKLQRNHSRKRNCGEVSK